MIRLTLQHGSKIFDRFRVISPVQVQRTAQQQRVRDLLVFPDIRRQRLDIIILEFPRVIKFLIRDGQRRVIIMFLVKLHDPLVKILHLPFS